LARTGQGSELLRTSVSKVRLVPTVVMLCGQSASPASAHNVMHTAQLKLNTSMASSWQLPSDECLAASCVHKLNTAATDWQIKQM